MKKNIVVSLFDYSCIMVQPWKDAGYECYIVDILHEQFKEGRQDGIHRIKHDLTQPWLPPFERERIKIVFCFPPCDHLALSGRRWFKGKGLRALSHSISMFATSAEFSEWSKAPYLIENPISTISTYWRQPDYKFNPCDYTGFCKEDNYTKKTCLWVGNGFIMPEPFRDISLGEPDERIWRCNLSGEKRKQFRNKTPRGFALAVFNANHRTWRDTENLFFKG